MTIRNPISVIWQVVNIVLWIGLIFVGMQLVGSHVGKQKVLEAVQVLKKESKEVRHFVFPVQKNVAEKAIESSKTFIYSVLNVFLEDMARTVGHLLAYGSVAIIIIFAIKKYLP